MTFTIRVRGATSGMIEHEYLCSVHGRFIANVSRADSPDVIPCKLDPFCREQAWWSPSGAPAVHTQFVVSATQGKWEPKPHRLAMDLQPDESRTAWKKRRREMWDQERKARVMKMVADG